MDLKQGRARRWLSLCAKGITLLVGVQYATGFLARAHRLLDVATSFPVYGCIAALLCSVLFLALGKKRWAGVAAVLMLAHGALVAPWYLGRQAAPSETPRLRMMTANVHHLNHDYERFVDLVLQEDPDMFVVCELSEAWFQGLQPLLERYPHHVAEPQPEVLRTGLFSKYPLEDARMFWILPGTYSTVAAGVEVNGARIHVLAVHAVPTFRIAFPPAKRVWEERRNGTFAAIPELLPGDGEACIILGDHNTTMWSPYYQDLMREGRLANARQGFGILPTWPTYCPFLMIPIDQCLYRGPLTVADCRTSPGFGSDHLALIVDFALGEGEVLAQASLNR